MGEDLYILRGDAEIKAGIHYEIDFNKLLGEGGMGRVFYGYRVDEKKGTKSEVAVKFLYDHLSSSVVSRARREASIQLRNDSLVLMYGLVEVKGTDDNGSEVTHLHVVSEYLRGVALFDMLQGKTCDKFGDAIPYAEELLEKYNNQREECAVLILKNILLGIIALHDAGYIHRDIDPTNIMVTSDGHIKLIDFGVARLFNKLKTDTIYTKTIYGNIIGKPAYAAPEIAYGDIDHHDETTDIYALGIMLFELLTGHLPFTGPINEVIEMQKHEEVPVDEIHDEYLREIVRKSTQKLQKNRYQSASEFRAALDKYGKTQPEIESVSEASTQEPPVQETSLSEQPPHLLQTSKEWIFWAASIGIGATLGIVLGFLL